MAKIKETIKPNAWDALGMVVEKETDTSAAAFHKAKYDFNIEKRPVTATLPNKKTVKIPDQYVTVRSDTSDILGLVGEKYTILQNNEAFAFFDPIVAKGIARYESVGMFGNGDRVFTNVEINKLVQIGDAKKRDEIQFNVFMTNSHNSEGAIMALINPVRALSNVCLNAAMPQRNNRVTYRHTNGLHNTLLMEGADTVMSYLTDYIEYLPNILSKMITTPADDATYEKVIVSAMADNENMITDYFTPNPSKRFVGIVEKVLDFALTHETQLTKSTKNTVFGAYNAVAGYFQLIHEWDSAEEKTRMIIDGGSRLSKRVQKSFDECLKLIK